ncbi:hypothetical protein [Halorubrum sp. PV6]|uniref:hypothetical protein n=1 Tax=Halorubrum sp. PV6 TaxID=634157 RepID=UPI0014480CF2|nr:hypothetical protein [Halorubrum sp. PV6]
MYKRRQLLATAGVATISGFAGCSSLGVNGGSPDSSGGSDEGTPENPVAAANPWLGTIAHFSDGSSPTEIRNTFNADIPRILVAPATPQNTAFISTEDVNTIEESAQEADLETRGIMSVSWNGGPVCDIQNWVQIPSEPSESTVRQAFPNAIFVFLNTSSGEDTWEIYTPQMERSELAGGLEQLGVASESSVLGYSSCSTAEPTTSESTVEASPKEAVRSYLTATFSGEVQAANALIHPDGNVSEYTEEAAEQSESFNLTIESLEIAEESEDTATVNAVISANNIETDEQLRRSVVYQLRTDGGTWKIYNEESEPA